MKISVIIPTFNRAHTLKRAIDSVLNQSYQDFDLWIIDDGSTDETSELIKSYGDKLNYIKIENQGVSAARNVGIRSSSGEWLSFLDSDDEWLEDKLQKQVDYLALNKGVRLVHGEEVWYRKGKRVNPKFKHKKSGGDIFSSCLKLCLISPSAVTIRRDLLEECNGFDEEFIVCEDYDLWLKVTANEIVGFIEDPIINKYGGHEDQLSAKYFAMDYYRIWSMMKLCKKGLSKVKLKLLYEEVLIKSEILIKGYIKHNNLSRLNEVQDWKETAFKERERLN